MIGNVHDYYVQRARWIAERETAPEALPDAKTWETQRAEMYRRFMASLGLDAMPAPDERCDLKATEMGSFSGPGYTVRKLAYQLLPDCWGSAHLYRPADVAADKPLPGVLYACGHDIAGVKGYQHHAIGWARRGYTCLIFDTIQQHDNPGDHHGLNRGKTPEWIALGFSGAGGEVFNGIRALDLFVSQPGVDAERIGVTGISGGGSQSFFLAIADDRLKAVATACGVSSPDYAIHNAHLHQHCDCIYCRNLFGHEVSHYAALIAPRALLYCFARHDALFTPAEFRALYRRTQARFERLGCAEQCELCEYDGPHGYNHTETTDTIHHWFDKHVAGETHPDVDTVAIQDEVLDEPTLSVFHGAPPEPNHLDLLPRLLSPRGRLSLPEKPEQWPTIQKEATEQLRTLVFSQLDDVREPQQPLEHIGCWSSKLVRTAPKDAFEWERWRTHLDGMEQQVAQIAPADNHHEAVLIGLSDREVDVRQVAGDLRGEIHRPDISTMGLLPRGGGFAAFREDWRNRLNREGCLVGLTPTMMMIQDLHHLWPALKAMPRVQGRKLYLYGKGEGAIAMLYHALLHPDPDLAGVIFDGLPESHTETTHQIMSVLRVMDIPQAVGLLAPLPVALINPGGGKFWWYWARRAFDRVPGAALHEVAHVGEALARIAPQRAEADAVV